MKKKTLVVDLACIFTELSILQYTKKQIISGYKEENILPYYNFTDSEKLSYLDSISTNILFNYVMNNKIDKVIFVVNEDVNKIPYSKFIELTRFGDITKVKLYSRNKLVRKIDKLNNKNSFFLFTDKLDLDPCFFQGDKSIMIDSSIGLAEYFVNKKLEKDIVWKDE